MPQYKLEYAYKETIFHGGANDKHVNYLSFGPGNCEVTFDADSDEEFEKQADALGERVEQFVARRRDIAFEALSK